MSTATVEQLDIFAPAPAVDPHRAITDRLSRDPAREYERSVIVDRIANAVRADGRVSANDWRGQVPEWINHKLVGVTVRALTRIGVLVATGLYEPSTDHAGGNAGKPIPIYRWRPQP